MVTAGFRCFQEAFLFWMPLDVDLNDATDDVVLVPGI
jgi:hypothetical protein